MNIFWTALPMKERIGHDRTKYGRGKEWPTYNIVDFKQAE